jgi:hypothetical protein
LPEEIGQGKAVHALASGQGHDKINQEEFKCNEQEDGKEKEGAHVAN